MAPRQRRTPDTRRTVRWKEMGDHTRSDSPRQVNGSFLRWTALLIHSRSHSRCCYSSTLFPFPLRVFTLLLLYLSFASFVERNPSFARGIRYEVRTDIAPSLNMSEKHKLFWGGQTFIQKIAAHSFAFSASPFLISASRISTSQARQRSSISASHQATPSSRLTVPAVKSIFRHGRDMHAQ